MSGYFEMLPPELLQDILERLHFRDKVPLTQCNKTLLEYIDPQIFADKAPRDMAMHWAIGNGCMSLVRRLVDKHGASPSFYGGTILPGFDEVDSSPIGFGGMQQMRYPQSTLLAVLKRAPHGTDALKTFEELGATVYPQECTRSQKDVAEADFDREEIYSTLDGQRRTLFRRIVSMPTDTDEHVRDKTAFIRFFYEKGYWKRPDVVGTTCNIAYALPRLIRSDEDLPVVKYVLEQERESNFELSWQGARSLLNRPEAHGPRGALVSPLSHCILTDSREIFDYLLKCGASIHGPSVSFEKVGPTEHALHIPIFAAAYTMSRRKTNEAGRYWMFHCISVGARINTMALCRLSGAHKPYRPVEASLSYYSQGLRYPAKYYFWATPMDVFFDCLSADYLRKRAVQCDEYDVFNNELTEDGTVYSAAKNMEAFIANGAVADLGSLRAPPRPKRPMPGLDDDGTEVPGSDMDMDTETVVNGNKAGDEKSIIYPGPATDPSLDQWRNLKRVVSPVTLEVLLDRITVSGLAYPVACSYAEILTQQLKSGLSQAARLMSKYDGPAWETRFPSWPSGPESTGRRTLAMILLCDGDAADQSRELHRYIVYVQRRAGLLFLGNVLSNLEQVFSGPRWMIDVNGPYQPQPATDDIELRQELDKDDAGIRRTLGNSPEDSEWRQKYTAARHQKSPGTKAKMKKWTAMHELCWMWNHQLYLCDLKIAGGIPHADVSAEKPRFAGRPESTTTLLNALISYGFSISQEADDGK
ncbi:hypothetical protein SCUCBS95973_007765 [Sporothrix curviconia]|uniref:F-box domain-containing protein n=1 Tax=Sporothrix curviconia TaxID=1260050 RepID=A0ABP0CG22_9PEZI